MLYGRVDVAAPSQCPKEGNLPDAKPPFGDGARDAAAHLRAIFSSHFLSADMRQPPAIVIGCLG